MTTPMQDTLPVRLVPVSRLRPHERIQPDRLRSVIESLQSSQQIETPLLLDEVSGTILDGHHRYHAAKKLGIPVLPCIVVSYETEDRVSLESWRAGEHITKRQVIQHGLSGKLLPPKSSRHTLNASVDFAPVPIAYLKRSIVRGCGSSEPHPQKSGARRPRFFVDNGLSRSVRVRTRH
jgi:hypothetical protein